MHATWRAHAHAHSPRRVKFDVRLMQRVPYEGVSRMQTSLKRKHRDRVVRRGLALIIESDFYATDAGRQHFADQLTSIRYCVQETCSARRDLQPFQPCPPSTGSRSPARSRACEDFDVLYAYLTSTNYDFSYDRAKNLRPKRNIKTAMNHEILLYGIAQKEQLGFDKAVEECKYRMSRYGVTPNLLVLPPQMLLYMALAPEEKLTYKEGGPAAEARFEGGVAGFEARSFRGCGVVTSEPFEVSDDNESLQMLTRSSQIGEFYVMSPPQVPPKGDNGMHTCDLLVYDEESDRHVRITWEEALEATLVYDATGFYDDAADTTMADGDQNKTKLSEWKASAEEWSKFNKGTQDYKATIDAGGKLDCRIIVARPFIEHLMVRCSPLAPLATRTRV